MKYESDYQSCRKTAKKTWLFCAFLTTIMVIGASLSLTRQFLLAQSPSLASDTHQAMVDAIRDEYQARAFYLAIIEKFGTIRPFTNIVQSETRHAEHLSQLFRDYNLPVPEDTFAGNISAPETLQQACQMAITAEIENVAMYDQFLEFVQEDDLRATFTQLRSVSLNRHKPAFEKCLNNRLSGH